MNRFLLVAMPIGMVLFYLFLTPYTSGDGPWGRDVQRVLNTLACVPGIMGVVLLPYCLVGALRKWSGKVQAEVR